MCCVFLAPWLKAQQQGVGFSVNTTAAVISATNLEARWDPHSHILLDPPDAIPKLVFLMAGPGLFNQDGNSVAWTVQITVTPSNGYKLKSPHSADPGTSVELTFRYTSEQSRLDIVSSTGQFLSDKLVFEKDEADTPLEIHVVPVILHKVAFESTIPDLQSDAGAAAAGAITYAAPQWRDGNFDKTVNPGFEVGSDTHAGMQKDRSYPTAFAKATTPKANAWCRLGNPLPTGIELELEAFPNKPGMEITYRPLVINGLNADFGAFIPAKDPLSNEIECFDSGGTMFSDTFWIDWAIRMKSGQGVSLQTTKHTIYQTAGTPILNIYGARESLFFYACFAGRGITPASESAIVEGIYNVTFRPRSFQRVIPCRAKADGTVSAVNFWGPGWANGYIPTLPGAVCQYWAEFMVGVVRVHGFQGFKSVALEIDQTVVHPSNPTWKLHAWLVRDRAAYINGQRDEPPWTPYWAQGGTTPFKEWSDHWVVAQITGSAPTVVIGPIYDPSYGSGPFVDLGAYQWLGTGGYRWEDHGDRFHYDLPAASEIIITLVKP